MLTAGGILVRRALRRASLRPGNSVNSHTQRNLRVSPYVWRPERQWKFLLGPGTG
jgi:hypothetical protein